MDLTMCEWKSVDTIFHTFHTRDRWALLRVPDETAIQGTDVAKRASGRLLAARAPVNHKTRLDISCGYCCCDRVTYMLGWGIYHCARTSFTCTVNLSPMHIGSWLLALLVMLNSELLV